MKSILLLLTFLTTSYYSLAQQGTLAGLVKDKKTGEPVIGAVVFITGSTKASATDVDGKYEIKLDAGIYKISVSNLAYKQTAIDNVKVEANKTTTLNISVEENVNQLDAVSIVGTRQTNTEIALIDELKTSEVVVSGVSGEQIAKSLDRDAAETVKRIPGVTIMNDRYIVIRGMSERYNTVMLNNALTPSTETDVKAFSFDILPTSVIDRIMIYKGGSPELPGEFGGGVIKIYTKNVVTENSTNFSISTSHRGGTTFRNFNTYKGGKTDFLGFDDGSRQIPESFPNKINSNQVTPDMVNNYRSLSNTWAPNQTEAMPDLRMSLGLNRKFNLGDVQISNISAVSYSNTRTFTEGSRTKYNDFIPELGRSEKNFDYNDQTSTQNVRLGVVHNWTARLNNNNKIEFRNLFNQLGQSQALVRNGQDVSNGNDVQGYTLRYESRRIYSGQVQGTHDFNGEKSTVTWTGGYSNTKRDEPDYRRVRLQRETGSNDPFLVTYKPVPSLVDAGRFFSKMNENVFTANGEFEHRFIKTEGEAENAPKIRTGFYAERKDRSFDARFLSYSPANSRTFDTNILALPLNEVFAPENINTTTGWTLQEGTNPADSYTAANSLVAGYVGGSITLTEKLSAAGGVRTEYNLQELKSLNSTGKEIIVNNPVFNVLPSLNLTYNFNLRSLLRMSNSISVNRPEFRELAPFTYYDFNTALEISGNPELKSATIYNADLRYEFYPNPTELLSIGVFGKYFNNPIETYFPPTSGANALSFRNSQHATSFGVETEIRKSLVDVFANPYLQNLSLVLNGALIKSEVTLDEQSVADGMDPKRQMMGQSPYILNTGLYYQDEPNQLQVSLLYNVLGKRIFAVGNFANPTVYEMPRNVLDLSFTKGFGEHFEIKAGIQDLLNQRFRFIQDSDRDSKITDTDESFLNYKKGTYSTFGITYKF